MGAHLTSLARDFREGDLREGLSIHLHNLCFLGFGNVNRALVRLLEERAAELRDRYGITYRITGVASRRLGWIADANGIDTTAALAWISERQGHGLSRGDETDRGSGLQRLTDA